MDARRAVLLALLACASAQAISGVDTTARGSFPALVSASDSGQATPRPQSTQPTGTDAELAKIPELHIPAQCTDNQFFANCQQIVRSKFCNHEYYSKFCCKSCVEAGQLNPQQLQLQYNE